MENNLLDAQQVAKFLCISKSTLDRLQRDNEIPVADYVVTKSFKRLWKASTIMNWLDIQCKNPRKEQAA